MVIVQPNFAEDGHLYWFSMYVNEQVVLGFLDKS
jgi:hypothetical protein